MKKFEVNWFWLLLFKLKIIRLNSIKLNDYENLKVSLTVIIFDKWIYKNKVKNWQMLKICEQSFDTRKNAVEEITSFFYWFKKHFKKSFVKDKYCFKCKKISFKNFVIIFDDMQPKRCDSCQIDWNHGM